MREPDTYEWIDPWREIEDALHIQRHWHEREECFYRDMRIAQQAAHENMYEVRRMNEKLMKAIADAAPVEYKWTAQQWREALS